MARTRTLAFVLLAATLWLSTPARVAADDKLTGEAAFQAGIDEVKDLLGKEWWRQGLEMFQALVKEHKNRDYVKARRVELEDLARRLAFGKMFPPPKPKDMVSGKLYRYVSATGRIKLKYTPQTAKDLQKIDGELLAFPVPFTSAFTVTIKGDRYPKRPEDSPQVIVGMRKNEKTGRFESWRIITGCAPTRSGNREVRMPATLLKFDGKKNEKISSKELYPGKPGRSYTIKVKMTNTRLSASLNGSRIAKTRKPAGVFGVVAFASPGWKELTLEGAIEPSWIQSQIDAIVQANLEKFRARYKPTDVLPRWLLEAPAVAPRKTLAKADRFPAGLSARQRRALERVDRKIEEGNYLDAVVALEALRRQQIPPSALSYVTAKAYLGVGRLPEALEEVERCLKSAPDFMYAQLLRGNVLDHLGRTEEAAAVFEAAMKAHPAEPVVYETAALTNLRDGRLDRATKIIQQGTRSGAASDRLQALGRVAVKAAHGPTWARRYDYKSKNYHVFSDIDAATCRKAAKTLEEANRAYQSTLEYVPPDETRLFKVYLFGGRGGFNTYLQDLEVFGGGGAPPMAAGMYSPWLKQLLIWNLPSRDMMMRTVRHEGFHQYLDRLLTSPPAWFNEGLAEYYEHGHRVAGHIRFGRPNKNHVTYLLSHRRIPLERFLFQPSQDFYRAAPASYAQAWAFVHMLRRGKAEDKALFEQLLSDFQRMPAYAALMKAFPKKDLPALEKKIEKHLKKLSKE